MKTGSINAIVDSVIRPDACFAKISENTKDYFSAAVVIFAVASASALLSDMANISYWNSNGQNYLGFNAVSLSLSIAHTTLRNLVMITAIFFVGKKLGGNTSFKKTFAVMSFCLIPAIIGATVVPLALASASSIFFGTGNGGEATDIGANLSPNYIFDFASSAIISNGFAIFFAAWMLILLLKATKITNSFGTGKSAITVVSGIIIVFLSQIVFGIPSAILLHL